MALRLKLVMVGLSFAGSLWALPVIPNDSNGEVCARLLTHVERAKALESHLRPVINRWGTQLNPQQTRELVDFFGPLFRPMSVSQRSDIVSAALSGDKDHERLLDQIDYDGEADMFAVELVTKAHRFTILNHGQQSTALWRILAFLAYFQGEPIRRDDRH